MATINGSTATPHRRGAASIASLNLALPSDLSRRDTIFVVVLLWAFAKNEASDLNATQLRQVKAVADTLLAEFGAS